MVVGQDWRWLVTVRCEHHALVVFFLAFKNDVGFWKENERRRFIGSLAMVISSVHDHLLEHLGVTRDSIEYYCRRNRHRRVVGILEVLEVYPAKSKEEKRGSVRNAKRYRRSRRKYGSSY